MELYQLKCFLAAAHRGSFSKAAEDMHTTQSSISKIIARLEEDIDVTLFDRKKGKICLNANGVVFQKYVVSAFQNLDEGVSKIKQASQNKHHIVKIGCTASHRFASVLEEVQSMLPQYILESEEMSQEQLLKAFEHQEIDIGFLETDKEFTSPIFEEISRQYFVAFVTESHPAARQDSLCPSQLRDEIVCFNGLEDDRRFIMHMCAVEGVQPKVFAEYSDPRVTAQLINSGAAIGLVPDELFYHKKRSSPKISLRALPISSQWYRRIYMLHSDTEHFREVYYTLRDCFKEERIQVLKFYSEHGIVFENTKNSI